HQVPESPRLFTSSVMDLLNCGDKAEVGDHDHAVAKAVENLAAPGCDVSGSGQETEAETERGTVS
ncbi:MAG: hypothetical protein ACOC38_05710, partial [Promethearchaeia archaeon]